jgi:8-oxo-dGTP pyrophosphatase MutT (NUDIX family)
MTTAALRYARSGYRALHGGHEAAVLAAETLLQHHRLEERDDKSIGLCYVWGPRVLVIRQRTQSGEHWALPKGHPEQGDEDDVATALREVLEETGVVVPRCSVLADVWAEVKYSFCGRIWEGDWLSHPRYPDERYRTCVFHKVVRYGLAREVGGEGGALGAPPAFNLQAAEVAAAEWLPVDEAKVRLTFEDERKALANLLKHL